MKLKGRTRRHKRITKKMKGQKKKPRLVVFRSNKYIYAQLVNDDSQKVVTGCSTLTKEFKEKKIKSAGIEAAKELGKLLAQKASKLGVKEVCFDRAGYRYHGRVKALADGVREGGVKF
ncbi:MAG: 50S ribosomal protein L18 [Candidatus Omnitrophota bacterium]|nr:MAG: 50S ribosomal protein L18 [Candidatus Omnitrophota bacterium]